MNNKRKVILLVVSLALVKLTYDYSQMPSSKYGAGGQVADVIRRLIYYCLKMGVDLVNDILDRWIGIENPIIGLGGFLFCLVLFLYLHMLWKQGRHRHRLAVYCPLDNSPSSPIPRSYNRYRCQHGHQFAGQPHVFEK